MHVAILRAQCIILCYTHTCTILRFEVSMYSCLKFCVLYIIATFVCVYHICGGTVAVVLTLEVLSGQQHTPTKEPPLTIFSIETV